MLEEFGRYVDITKIWDPHLLAPSAVVREKIEIYRSHDVLVQPGGLYMEVAKRAGQSERVLKELGLLPS